MAKLTDEQRKQLEELTALAEAPDDEPGSRRDRLENINMTIDLDNEEQVKRAVRAGFLPRSYLEDDDGEEKETETETVTDDAPIRKLDKRFS